MTSADNSPLEDHASLLKLSGRSFIVAGAGQGIGRQSAHALASQGAHVLCVDLNPTLADEIAEEIGGQPSVADVRNAEEVERVVQQAVSCFGHLYGIVDVIGSARWAAIADMPEDDWDWCHDMVLRHTYHFIKYGGRAMSAERGGTMVFVGSISGLGTAKFNAAYGAAKAGLKSLVRTAAVELRDKQIRVNSVAPGATATPSLVSFLGKPAEVLADGSLGAEAKPADIASAILFLSCGLSKHITGQTLVVDGGQTLLGPDERTEPPLPPGRSFVDEMNSSTPWGRMAGT